MQAKTAAAANAITNATIGIINTGSGSPSLRLYSGTTLCLQINLRTVANGGAFTASGSDSDEGSKGAVPGKAWAAAPVSGGEHWATFSQLPASGAQGLVVDSARYYDAAGTRQYDPTVGTIAAGTAEVQLTTLTMDEAVPVTTTATPYIATAVV
jgi:hypothetical protein